MDSKFLEKLLADITAAQKEAAELILHAHGIMTEMKSGHRDLVTDYDKRVQELVMERLRAALPDASFFCEENYVHDDLNGEHVFIIDPIDGTMNFVRRMHHSCIAVAYASRGEVLLAAVYNPYFDELFTAIKGQGAYLNGRAIHVEEAPLSETVFCMGTSPYKPALTEESFRLARIAMEASLDLRRFASAELDLCYVAAGRAGLYFELELSTWDYAAGRLIVEEAGGRCCTIDGGVIPLDGSKPSVLAGSKQALEDFLALIKKEN